MLLYVSFLFGEGSSTFTSSSWTNRQRESLKRYLKCISTLKQLVQWEWRKGGERKGEREGEKERGREGESEGVCVVLVFVLYTTSRLVR